MKYSQANAILRNCRHLPEPAVKGVVDVMLLVKPSDMTKVTFGHMLHLRAPKTISFDQFHALVFRRPSSILSTHPISQDPNRIYRNSGEPGASRHMSCLLLGPGSILSQQVILPALRTWDRGTELNVVCRAVSSVAVIVGQHFDAWRGALVRICSSSVVCMFAHTSSVFIEVLEALEAGSSSCMLSSASKQRILADIGPQRSRHGRVPRVFLSASYRAYQACNLCRLASTCMPATAPRPPFQPSSSSIPISPATCVLTHCSII